MLLTLHSLREFRFRSAAPSGNIKIYIYSNTRAMPCNPPGLAQVASGMGR